MGTSTGTEQQQCAFALYDSQALPLTELKNHIQAPCKPMYPDSPTRRPFLPPLFPLILSGLLSCLQSFVHVSAAAHATAPCPVSADASPGGTHISSSPPPPHQPIFYSGPLASACPLCLHTQHALRYAGTPRSLFLISITSVSPYLPQLSALCFSSHPAQRLPCSITLIHFIMDPCRRLM